MLELHQVAQRAEDLDRAVEFYTETLGSELIARFEPAGLAFVRMGKVRLLLEGNLVGLASRHPAGAVD